MPYHDSDIHLSDLTNYFNIQININSLKDKVKTILKRDYKLKVISEKTLDLKEL